MKVGLLSNTYPVKDCQNTTTSDQAVNLFLQESFDSPLKSPHTSTLSFEQCSLDHVQPQNVNRQISAVQYHRVCQHPSINMMYDPSNRCDLVKGST